MANPELHTLVFPREVNDLDAIHFDLGERAECNVAMTMAAVIDGEVAFEEVYSLFGELIDHFPRAAEYVKRMPADIAPPIWWPEENYQLRDHCREIRLPPGSTWADVIAEVDRLQSEPWRPDEALMHVRLVTEGPDGTSVLLLKMHHAMADGATLAFLFGQVFMQKEALGDIEVKAELEPLPRRVIVDAAARRLRRARAALPVAAREVKRLALAPDGLRQEREALASYVSPAGRWPVASHSESRFTAAYRLELDSWQELARRRGGGVNELYLAIVAASARRYLGGRIDGDPLRLVMPIDMRTGDGSQDTGSVLSVGLLTVRGDDRELEDLKEVRDASRVAQEEARRRSVCAVERIVGSLGGGLRGRLTFNRFCKEDIVATNLVIPFDGSFCGTPISELYMVAPAMGTPLSFTLASYRERVHLVLNMDLGLVPDPEAMAAALEGVLGEIFGPDAAVPLRRG